MTHLGASHHRARHERGALACGRRVRDHFRRTAVVELRWKCGQFFEVKNRPRANPGRGAGGGDRDRDGNVGCPIRVCIALPNVDDVKIGLLAKATPVKLILTSSIYGIAKR